MILPGQKLNPDFTLKVVRGGLVQEVSFRSLLTRRTIVSVYMKNNTGSCDRQNEALVAYAPELERLGYNLVALSRDTPGSQLKYAAKKNIPYVLASDPEDRFARAVDSVVEKSMYGRTFLGPARAAFAIDETGTVVAVASKADPANHAAQLRALIAGI